ncbi:hypothetical protein EJ02DRAFT_71547 [Clathrospora elynae]|uniref:HTH psq-type domain-containing protein n=1 Tax=Clathrospora elynae TaxID=706981 RepID=A0A6A5SYD7_9PLEO|nr:hypothetical protein EJ02DRAFT_71547 [Clathrospora elynae]
MEAIEDAIEAIESGEPGEDFLYRKVAETYNINQTTLSRRHKHYVCMHVCIHLMSYMSLRLWEDKRGSSPSSIEVVVLKRV